MDNTEILLGISTKYCDDDTSIATTTITDINQLVDYVLKSHDFSDRHTLLLSLLRDPIFKMALEQQGWVNTAEIKKMSDKAIIDERVYALERVPYMGYTVHDLRKMTSFAALSGAFVKGNGLLVRGVKEEAMKDISPQLHAAIESKKKLVKRQEDEKKRKKENKEANKLAAAKKLLECKGHKVTK